MEKIITLFQRNYEGDRRVRDEVTPGAEWVLNGEGIATRKYDGVCTMIHTSKDGTQLFKRFTMQHPGFVDEKGRLKKPSQPRTDFVPVTEMDAQTGKQEGWVPCHRDDPNDKYMFEAFDNTYGRDGVRAEDLITAATAARGATPDDSGQVTCEFLGPKSQGNVERYAEHRLLAHNQAAPLPDAPRTFEAIREYLTSGGIEGIVWHHPDGRMVKIKARDFGVKRS